MSKNEQEKIEKKLQKAINKLISEEWIAHTIYEQMILACDPSEKDIIIDMFLENSKEEKEDHYQKLVNFALENGFTVPCKMQDYEKYAAESTVSQFEKFQKNKKAGYYIQEAIKAEQDAIQSYAEVLQDEMICQEFKALVLDFYYDEITHLSNLNTLLLSYEVKMKMEF